MRLHYSALGRYVVIFFYNFVAAVIKSTASAASLEGFSGRDQGNKLNFQAMRKTAASAASSIQIQPLTLDDLVLSALYIRRCSLLERSSSQSSAPALTRHSG